MMNAVAEMIARKRSAVSSFFAFFSFLSSFSSVAVARLSVLFLFMDVMGKGN